MEQHTPQHRPASSGQKRRPAPGRRPSPNRQQVPGRQTAPGGKPASSGNRRPPQHNGAPAKRRPVSGEQRPAPRRPADDTRRPPQRNGAPAGRRPVQGQRPPQHRHPADKRRPVQSRHPADARYPAGNRRPSSGGYPAGSRRPADGRRPAGSRRPAGAASRRRRIAPVTKVSVLMFVILIILYIIAASVYISGRRKKADAYLAEYEASRPQYKIEEYVASLSDAFFDDMIRQSAEMIPVSSYETTEGIMDSMRLKSASADAAQPYSYIKKEDYTESRPTYYIMRGEEAVASVVLDRAGWTDHYNFPVWRVNQPESLLEVHAEPAYDISVTMPQGCVLNVNGNPVPEDIMTDADSDLELNTMEQNYMTQPTSKLCEMSGFYMPPTVEVKDREGNVLQPESMPDLNTAHHTYVFRPAADPNADPALKERVDAMTRAYMDYVINKNKDRFNNLAVLNNYLMPGSEAAVLMQAIINDIYWNNEYDGRTDDVQVEGIRVYSDKLCTADVHFDTTLTKNGVGTNEYISTIRWTLVNNGWGWYATSFDLHMDQE